MNDDDEEQEQEVVTQMECGACGAVATVIEGLLQCECGHGVSLG